MSSMSMGFFFCFKADCGPDSSTGSMKTRDLAECPTRLRRAKGRASRSAVLQGFGIPNPPLGESRALGLLQVRSGAPIRMIGYGFCLHSNSDSARALLGGF